MKAHLGPSTLDTFEVIAAELLAQVAGAGSDKPYIVKSGDNLSAIAQAHGVSLQDIEKWNPSFSKNWSLIHPDDKVNLGPTPAVIEFDPNDHSARYGDLP
jgi:hypothetical protein